MAAGLHKTKDIISLNYDFWIAGLLFELYFKIMVDFSNNFNFRIYFSHSIWDMDSHNTHSPPLYTFILENLASTGYHTLKKLYSGCRLFLSLVFKF